jgi:cobalt-zinc-cadmium efflux system outer membrane protein
LTRFARIFAGVVGAAAIAGAPHARAQDLLPAASASPDFGSALERDELVATALARNPTIPAAEAAVRAARERARQAGALDDPMGAAMVAPLSLGGGDAPLGYEVRASQSLPYPGKRELRRTVAEREADAAEQRLEQARLDLVAMASTLFADYHLVAQHQEVIAEHVALLQAFQRVATARYAAGLLSQQAPLQAELELAQMLQEQAKLRAQDRVLTAQLNALLHRAADAPLPPPAAASLPPSRRVAEEALDAALSGRPEALAQRAEVDARGAAVELARRGRYPDFEVMAAYSSMWDMPEHRLMLGVGVNLPLFRRRIRAEVAEAEAMLAAAEAERERIDDAFRARLAEAVAGVEEALEQVALYEDRVLPAARDQVKAARAAFESGAEPMLSLIEAERGLRSAELGYHEVVAAYFRHAAEAERQLGRLPASSPAEVTPQVTPEEVKEQQR